MKTWAKTENFSEGKFLVVRKSWLIWICGPRGPCLQRL
jgi:hypothetical protein